jgi:hypothetical protein
MTDTEAALRAIFNHLDPVPPLADEAARAAFGWRTIDAELAELMSDSAESEETLVRSAGTVSRQLSFESPRVGVELEVAPLGSRSRRLEGQLLPPISALVTVERPGRDGISVQADELGRFAFDELEAGPVRLRVIMGGAEIAIPWTTI